MITAEQPQISAGFRWLETVDEAFEVMLAAVERAQRTIRLEVYIYRASPIGEAFRDAFIRALRRGVKVWVLVDALGSVSLSDKFWEPFIEAGGEMRWFNPLKLRRLGFRDHRKMLVIDEEIGFVGGYNIAPEYQGDGVSKGWHDLGLKVPAELAQPLAASFDRQFRLADVRFRRFMRLRRSDVRQQVTTSEGELFINGPGRGPNLMINSIKNDLNSSRRIWIISAYFLPPRHLRRSLVRLARQGRDVRILLPGKSDVALSQYAARFLYHGLLRAGVKIYEYEPQILHTKMFLFDNAVYVGSANMDKRSLYMNYELLVRVQKPGLLTDAAVFFTDALERSKPVALHDWHRARSFWSKLREQWSYFVLSKLDPYVSELQLKLSKDIPHARPPEKAQP
ncbi:MAG TPA: phospholipase D-like domain-containing protein [Methylomirabilota bacterium]|nr:phospholipase D-like domain-containing protein [Methylomirabilota bacterium]